MCVAQRSYPAYLGSRSTLGCIAGGGCGCCSVSSFVVSRMLKVARDHAASGIGIGHGLPRQQSSGGGRPKRQSKLARALSMARPVVQLARVDEPLQKIYSRTAQCAEVGRSSLEQECTELKCTASTISATKSAVQCTMVCVVQPAHHVR